MSAGSVMELDQTDSGSLPFNLFRVASSGLVVEQVVQPSLLQYQIPDHAPISSVLDLLLKIRRGVLVPAMRRIVASRDSMLGGMQPSEITQGSLDQACMRIKASRASHQSLQLCRQANSHLQADSSNGEKHLSRHRKALFAMRQYQTAFLGCCISKETCTIPNLAHTDCTGRPCSPCGNTKQPFSGAASPKKHAPSRIWHIQIAQAELTFGPHAGGLGRL